MFFSRFIPCLMIAVETTAVTTRKYGTLDQTFGDNGIFVMQSMLQDKIINHLKYYWFHMTACIDIYEWYVFILHVHRTRMTMTRLVLLTNTITTRLILNLILD